MIDIYRYISDFKSTSDFENIYYFYEKHILFLCRRYNIEEYYNSLMIKLWELTIKVDLKKFNNSKLLDSYIRKSLKNFAINLYRKNVVFNSIIFNDDVTNIEIEKKSINIDYNYNIIFIDLIDKLPKRQYKIINLRYNYGFSDEEIASIIGISRQAVYKNRIAALNCLKKEIN